MMHSDMSTCPVYWNPEIEINRRFNDPDPTDDSWRDPDEWKGKSPRKPITKAKAKTRATRNRAKKLNRKKNRRK